MELLFNISELAIVTGDNPYKTKRDYLIDFWKKHDKNDYEKYVSYVNFVKETDEDIIKKITVNNKIDIKKELDQCIKSKNTEQLNEIKKEIFKKMDNLSESDKKEVTKSLNNVTNTNFGTKNEDSIKKLYESMTGSSIIKDDKYRKRIIYENDNFKIVIGGKIDGFNASDGSIIEIKNRVHRLFYSLRDYEKVQIIAYLHLFKCNLGHLVEAHKKDNNTLINIIEVQYDKKFMDYIFEHLLVFSIYFMNFLNDTQAKINLLKNKDEIVIKV
jgi:hypothetical protein